MAGLYSSGGMLRISSIRSCTVRIVERFGRELAHRALELDRDLATLSFDGRSGIPSLKRGERWPRHDGAGK